MLKTKDIELQNLESKGVPGFVTRFFRLSPLSLFYALEHNSFAVGISFRFRYLHVFRTWHVVFGGFSAKNSWTLVSWIVVEVWRMRGVWTPFLRMRRSWVGSRPL